MKFRAAIFDIYKTLLTVSPPPTDAGARWTALCARMLPDGERISLPEFGKRCDVIIEREHAAAAANGVKFPEVFWPHVTREAFPSLAALPPGELDAFLLEQVALWHTVSLAPGSATFLRSLMHTGVPLGIVSNCQPYTLHELDRCLAGDGLNHDIFNPSICFLSYQAGFSKPDPHVFRWLTARLADLGIAPRETLVVGDREDNDIMPAKAQGFLTWQITPQSAQDGGNGGTWTQLAERIRGFQ